MNFQTRLAEIFDNLPSDPQVTYDAWETFQQQITELFLEIIGEDEEIPQDIATLIPILTRIELRNELRKAIND